MPEAQVACTVLVVEDQTLVRMLGVDTLTDAGYRVLEASNADDALLILADHDNVHLLFSDIDMPGSMDGLELAQIVHQRWPNIRLLLTSGHHHLQNSSLPDHGKFLRKPWGEQVLVEKIRGILAAN